MEVVHLPSSPVPLGVGYGHCSHPGCTCRDLRIFLTEASEDGTRAAEPFIRLSFAVNVDTWQERDPPERPARVDAIVREFLAAMTAEDKAFYQGLFRERDEAARRLGECRLDPVRVRESELVPYMEVAAEEGSVASGGQGMSFRMDHDGSEYVIEDLYCPHPDCDCQEVALVFLKIVPEGMREDGTKVVAMDPQFMAMWGFEGRLKVRHLDNATSEEAESLLAAWRKEYGNQLETLKWRYGKLKEIGRRSLPIRVPRFDRPYRPVRSVAAPVKPAERMRAAGRNDPCPCGSGKKYKKCCGR